MKAVRNKSGQAEEMPQMLLNRHLGQSYSYRRNGRGQGIKDFPLLRFIYRKGPFKKQAFKYF